MHGKIPTTRLRRITLTFLASWLCCFSMAVAQTLTVRLINAKSGKPIRDKNVTFVWCPDCFTQSVVHIGKDGIALVSIPNGASTFAMMPGPRMGEEPGRIAFTDCNGGIKASIDLKEVISNGLVPKNTCGKKNASSRPGEVVFWALPLPWWEPDLQ